MDQLSPAQLVAFFEERAARYTAQELQSERRCLRLIQGRTLAFLALLASAAVGFFGYVPPLASYILGGGCAVAFAMLVHAHARAQFETIRARHLRAIQEDALARRRRDWKRLPLRRPPTSAGQVPSAQSFPRDGAPVLQASLAGPLAKDLDLTGPRSLYHLMCQAHTLWGKSAVEQWLLFPAPPETIRARQEAARELAPSVDFRHSLAVFGRLAESGESAGDARRLLDWAQGRPWILERPGVLWTARLLPLVLAALFIAWVAGWVPGSLVALAGIINLVFTFLFASRIHSLFAEVSSRHGEVKRYAEMLDIAAGGPRECGELRRLHDILAPAGEIAASCLHALANLANLANLRFSPMIYFVLQIGGLWDFHVLAALDRWRQRHGLQLAQWLEALGELEAIASWGAIAQENPDWSFPTVSETESAIVAAALGHPLLVESSRVTNDVTVGPPGTFLFVTGSNMSGKSTLLRSIGVNVQLAQAGAPVCAAKLAMPPLRVATSMRIQDSLEDGVSFFMAELKRLKQIVDLGRRGDESEPRLLYLLDEILQGTNTAERQIAVRQVLAHLLSEGAIGAVSSHDLALADHPLLARACRPIHFRETIHAAGEGPPMTFDYHIRPGVATTTNALKLLALVGLAATSDADADASERERIASVDGGG